MKRINFFIFLFFPSICFSSGIYNPGSGSGGGGGGSGIVSPGTFTWTNEFGVHVSTLDLDVSTSTGGWITQNGQRFISSFGDNFFSEGTGTPSGNLTLTGSFNVAIGDNALVSLTSASDNVALGHNALANTTSGGGNFAAGSAALSHNTTGTGNVAFLGDLQSNSSGINNLAMGSSSLVSNVSGSYNVAMGAQVMNAESTGSGNVAVGGGLDSMQDGQLNVSIGSVLGGPFTSEQHGSNDVGIGTNACTLINTSQNDNTCIGHNSGTGTGSIFVSSTTQSTKDTLVTFIGSYASRAVDVSTATALNKITAIGYNAKVGCSNCMALGGTGVDAVNVGIGIAHPATSLHISSGTLQIDGNVSPAIQIFGSGAPPNSFALCLLNGQLGHCTTVVGAAGGCTCSVP
jgi:hypothetical protein